MLFNRLLKRVNNKLESVSEKFQFQLGKFSSFPTCWTASVLGNPLGQTIGLDYGTQTRPKVYFRYPGRHERRSEGSATTANDSGAACSEEAPRRLIQVYAFWTLLATVLSVYSPRSRNDDYCCLQTGFYSRHAMECVYRKVFKQQQLWKSVEGAWWWRKKAQAWNPPVDAKESEIVHFIISIIVDITNFLYSSLMQMIYEAICCCGGVLISKEMRRMRD